MKLNPATLKLSNDLAPTSRFHYKHNPSFREFLRFGMNVTGIILCISAAYYSVPSFAQQFH